MKEIVVWTKYGCTNCDQAKALLKQKGLTYEERKIGDGWTKEDLLESVPAARTVPQIFVDSHHIGGFSELRKLLESENVDQ